LNINLRGTRFSIDNQVKWKNYGEKPRSQIKFSHVISWLISYINILLSFFFIILKDRTKIYGTCGGYCGFCRPDPTVGFKVRIV
jgi:hypothetical protein